MTRIRLLLFAGLSITLLEAYTPWTTPTAIPLHRTDAANVQFLVNQSTAAGMTNADGNPTISADSNPMTALGNAASTWSNVRTAAVSFLPLQTTAAVNDPADNQNTIVFLDTPENRSVIGSAVAFTVISYYSDGRIADTDILFNPAYTFSTTLEPGTYDLQSVATHEIGHALGANHSGVLAASMFWGLDQQTNSPSMLSADDVAFATATYPGPGSSSTFGVISGTVSLTTGAPVPGAFLAAADPVSGITVGGFSSLIDGTYSFQVPRGSYVLYAEPLDGEVLPGNLYLTDSQVNASFQTAFFGGTAAPQLVDVTSGQASANIVVAPGAAPFSLQQSGTGSVGGSGDFEIAPGPTPLTAGQPVDVLLYGIGLDSPGARYDVRLIGAGVTIRQNSIHFDPNTSVNGSRLLRMTVDVAPQASPITASIIVVNNSVAATLSGGLLVSPAPAKK
jgi:Matrixin